MRGQVPVPLPGGNEQADTGGAASGVGVGFGTGVGITVGVGEGAGPTGTLLGLAEGAGLSGEPGPEGSCSTIFLMQPAEANAKAKPTGRALDQTRIADPQARINLRILALSIDQIKTNRMAQKVEG